MEFILQKVFRQSPDSLMPLIFSSEVAFFNSNEIIFSSLVAKFDNNKIMPIMKNILNGIQVGIKWF